jgi:hypothetical protein
MTHEEWGTFLYHLCSYEYLYPQEKVTLTQSHTLFITPKDKCVSIPEKQEEETKDGRKIVLLWLF